EGLDGRGRLGGGRNLARERGGQPTRCVAGSHGNPNATTFAVSARGRGRRRRARLTRTEPALYHPKRSHTSRRNVARRRRDDGERSAEKPPVSRVLRAVPAV